MQNNESAKAWRIMAQAALRIADVLENAGTDDLKSVPADNASSETKRAAYLQAYVDAGAPLTLPQVRQAAKAAGLGNPGPATTNGYVEILSGPPNELRAITAKGLAWLKQWTDKA